MKRWILYLAIIGVAAMSPIERTDIAKLAPIEVVWIAEKAGQVYLETDTGDVGCGDNVQEALKDMKATTSGVIFLETADYVIVEQGREALLKQCSSVLRPSCKVCTAKSIPNMETVAEFLSAHEPKQTLRQWRVEQMGLGMLNEKEGRLELIAQ